MDTIWADIQGFDYPYKISNHGDVYSPKLKRPLKHKLTRDGYYVVRLTKKGKSFCTGIHRLLAQYFLESQPSEAHVVNHINGIKTDNRLINLEWCTNKQNIQHFFTHCNGNSTRARGYGWNKKAKFTNEEVQLIRSLKNDGLSYSQICKHFQNRMTIQGCRYICIRKTYSHID